MAGRTQAEIDVLPYQKVTKAMLHGDPDEGNDVSEVNLTEYVLEAEVLLSHSWVEDMDECHEALNSYCESADWKRVKYHAIGTCDFLQRNRWYCVDCGLNVSLETAG